MTSYRVFKAICPLKMGRFPCIISLVVVIVTAIVLFLVVGLFLRVNFKEIPDVFSPLTETSWRRKVLEYGEIDRFRFVYLFNWTNYEQYLHGNNSPNFCEVGPFVFKEERVMRPVDWKIDEVRYTRERLWTIAKDKSVNLDINITNFNVIFALTVEKMKNVTENLNQRLFDYLIDYKANLFTTQRARSLLFDGYKDRTFQHYKSIPLVQEKFGWFLNENGSTDGLWTFSSNGDLTSFEGLKLYFRETFSDGAVFLFEPKYSRVIVLKSSDEFLNRRNEMEYLGSDENIAKCWDGTRNCVANLLPYTLSLPHFLGRKNPSEVTGLNPKPEVHRTVVIRDKLTGLNIRTNVTYQLNIRLSPLTWSHTYLRNISPVEIPLMWYKETSYMSPNVTRDMTYYEQLLQRYFISNCLLATSSAIALSIVCTIIFLNNCYSSRNSLPEIPRNLLVEQ